MKKVPLLSIVIPTWNRTAPLFTLIQSIGHKNDPEVEIVITDNNSTPEIFKEVEAFCLNYSNINLYKNPVDFGMVKNWNECIGKAQGRWICFICSDDVFCTGGVARILDLIKEINKVCLVIQSPTLTNERTDCEAGYKTVAQLNFPIVSGNFWHREITDQLGGFDERIKYSPDAEFWVRITKTYPVIKLKEPIARYISHADNYAYTTWTKDDFLDQVGLITEITYPYFHEGEVLPEKIRVAAEIGKDQTINTILNTLCLRSGKNILFKKYYKIGLERYGKKGKALDFRLMVLVIYTKRTLSIIIKRGLHILQPIFRGRP